MRVLVIVKATKDSEAGKMPSAEEFAEMGEFNEVLIKEGIMEAGEGLQASAKGKRVKFPAGKKPTVTDGPFSETKELIAGFWIWKVKSIDEALEWIKKAPFKKNEEIEIRKIMDAEDFGKEFTPELRKQEASQRKRIEQAKK